MKQITISLYSFSELSKEAKHKAVLSHRQFLYEVGEPHNNEYVIESIEMNDYLFFEDGKLAHCTTYTGKHQKTGITEFHFHGRTFDITELAIT